MPRRRSPAPRSGLRAWTARHDPHVRAAVELLIDHDHWLRNGHFVRACVRTSRSDGTVWIDWRAARDTYERGLIGSSTELAVLDYAIALGENRYRLAAMDRTNSRLLITATTRALGATAR